MIALTCRRWPGIRIPDWNSTSTGTRINGRLVVWGRLRDDDELAIAHLNYRLVIDELAGPVEALPIGESEVLDTGRGPSSPALETVRDVETLERFGEGHCRD